MTTDGIGDIAGGMMILSLGGLIYLDSGFFIFIIVLLGPASVLCRRKITTHRLGSFNVDSVPPEHLKHPFLRYFIPTILVFGILFGGLSALGVISPVVPEIDVLIIVGILAAFVMTIAGSYTGIRRLYFYGVVLLGLFIHGSLKKYPVIDGMDIVRRALGAHIMAFGSVMVLSGVVVLLRFLKKYPILEDSENGI